MTTMRIDEFTDGAWLALLSITLIVLFQRVLQLLRGLALDALPRQYLYNNRTIERNLDLVSGAIMVLVSICAANISLPDNWVQSIISALSVGIGFALRDALSETLYGIQSSALYDKTFKLNNNLPETIDDVEKMRKNQATYKLVKEEIQALSCTVVNIDDETLKYRVPWSYLHTRILQYKT